MTGSTIQATLDGVDLLIGGDPAQSDTVRTRFGRLSLAIVCFAGGCASAALLYWLLGFWCLLVPVVIGTVTAITETENPD